MAEIARMGVDIGVEDESDQPAIIMDELLHLGIHGRALGLIGFGAGSD